MTRFYRALERGDGHEAAMLVVPEKRQSGPLSEEALTAFYSNLAIPLHLIDASPTNTGSIIVKYKYTHRGWKFCNGLSTVYMYEDIGNTLINEIHSESKC